MTVMLAAAIVCAVAASASATALETSGELRARAWYLKNYFATGKNTEFWDQRLRVNLVWPVAENVKVNVRADILEGFWGENQSAAKHTVSTSDLGVVTVAENPAQPWEAKQEIWFDQANMVFVWPNTPLTFTIGRQDVTWGTGFYAAADNRDRFKVVGKFDPVTIGFSFDKNQEVFLEHASKDDSRGYTLSASTTAGGFKVGALVAYVLDQTRTGTVVDKKYVAGDVFLMGKAGMVDLKAEAAYLTGDSGLRNADGTKQELTGMGAYVGAFIPVGPATIGLEGAYVAGDDPTTKKAENGFSSDYQGPFWSVIFYQNMDYPGMALDAQTSNPATDLQVKNATAGKLSCVLSPMKGLTVIANALIASANEVAAGSKAMGEEVDLVLVYGITDNVSLTAGIGYGILGDYWKGKLGAKAGEKPDNPIGTVASFNVKF
jgi:hypothetical protein